VTSLVIGYARVSRFGGDADEQRAALLALGVAADRVYLDMGLIGMIRPRPALREALAVARGGDKLVVTALSRLARSVPDAHELLNGLAAGEVTLAIGEDHYPPSLPVTHVLVEVLALTAQLQTGLDSRRTRVGLAAARTRGQLRGRPPKLNHRQERHIVGLYWTGRYTVREIGELFNVSRSTVYRAVRRADRTADSDAAHSAGEPAPGMQPTLNTVAETADLFNLGH